MWIFDLHLIASRLTMVEWMEFLDLADRRKVVAICRQGLSLAAEHFGTVIPPGVMADSRVSAAADGHEPSAAFLSRDRAHLRRLSPTCGRCGRGAIGDGCCGSICVHRLPTCVRSTRRRAGLRMLPCTPGERCAARGAGSCVLDTLPTEMLMSPGDRLIPSDSVVTRVVNGSTVLLNTDTGRYFTLDEVGGRAWTVLTSSPSIQDARDQLLDEYPWIPTS